MSRPVTILGGVPKPVAAPAPPPSGFPAPAPSSTASVALGAGASANLPPAPMNIAPAPPPAATAAISNSNTAASVPSAAPAQIYYPPQPVPAPAMQYQPAPAAAGPQGVVTINGIQMYIMGYAQNGTPIYAPVNAVTNALPVAPVISASNGATAGMTLPVPNIQPAAIPAVVRLHQGSERIIRNPKGIDFPNMVRISTIDNNDGSSILHALFNSIFKDYRLGVVGGKEIDRVELVRERRNHLANSLDKKHPDSGSDVSYYQFLEDGQLPNLAKTQDKYSLDFMREELLSDRPLGIKYLQYFSEFYSVNIYIINLANVDMLPLLPQGSTDYSLYYSNKRKQCAVIGAVDGEHFETIAIEGKPNEHQMPFKYDNPFIKTLRTRLGKM